MPIRLVREGINSSQRINALTRGAELFYRRLMSVVDDYGRFYASPGTLRGACWPTCPDHVLETEVEQWLTECLQVHSKCLAGAIQITPLMFLYEYGGCKYLQLTDFRQQTRSPSKFPEPAKQSLITCTENVLPRRETKTKTKTKFEDEDGDVKVAAAQQNPNSNGHLGAPSWVLDESYLPFAELARKFWPRILEEEISQGHHWYWAKLDFSDRLKATSNLRLRVEAAEDGEFVKHMPDYLKSEWRRGPKPSDKKSRNGFIEDQKSTYRPLPIYEPPKD